jgi:hypothetical protein
MDKSTDPVIIKCNVSSSEPFGTGLFIGCVLGLFDDVSSSSDTTGSNETVSDNELIAGFRAEIWNLDLPNTKQECFTTTPPWR